MPNCSSCHSKVSDGSQHPLVHIWVLAYTDQISSTLPAGPDEVLMHWAHHQDVMATQDILGFEI